MATTLQKHDALHVIKDLQDSIGVKGLSCFEVPKLVSGSTGLGPTKDYYTLDNVRAMKDLIEQGVTIEECFTFVIAKMKLSDETPNYYYVKKCIPEWLRYIAWLWEQQGVSVMETGFSPPQEQKQGKNSMFATARFPVPQVTHGQGASIIKRALQHLQDQALEPIDINKLRIEQNNNLIDFSYEFDPKTGESQK